MEQSIITKPSFSLNNHYRWGFNEGWFNKPEPVGYFKNAIGSCTREHRSFREECILSAHLINMNTTKPLLVGLSGGNDSQVVCLSFMYAGVKFQPLIMRLHDGQGHYYNDHDTNGAFEFCKKYNLDYIVEELNIDEFYTGWGLDLIKEYCITVAEIAIQLYPVIKYKDTHAYVNGGGDPNIGYKQYLDGTSSLTYSLGPTPVQQYLIDRNMEGCMKFFMYTPEQLAAYLDNDTVHAFNNARDQIYQGSRSDPWQYCVKPMFYIKEFPEIVQQPKYDGFELVPYIGKLRNVVHRLHAHINPRAKKVTWAYEEMLDHLLLGGGKIGIWRSDSDQQGE